MSWLEQYRTQARYNRWMNDKLYAACATLSDDERRRDRGAFFKSIHETLNHLLVADSIWLGRFTGKRDHLPKDSAGEPIEIKSLTQPLYPTFEQMISARRALDAYIQAWVDALDDTALAGDFSFKTMAGVAQTSALWGTLTHFFNHQTHHRGQVTTLLSQRGVDVGVTDLVAMIREERTKH